MSSTEHESQIPLPHIYDWNRPFFEGGLDGKLLLQRCQNCGQLVYYPRIACPECLSMDLDWEAMSGRGTVYSYSFVWRPQHPAFLPQVPITLATITLEEGVQMVSNVVFDRIAKRIALPKFEPAPEG
jgi:uncharacterized OB-fold protein